MRVAIYSRVSTDGQDATNQLDALRQYCEAQGYTITKEYVDVASGSKAERQQFKAMMADASKRKFDTLLFWSLDRLSREGVLQTLNYLQSLTAYGTQYKSFSEQYLDSLGPFRDAVIAILASIARQEKIRISERTRAGLAKARSKGRVGGRPKSLSSADRLEIYRLRKSGLTVAEVAKQLKVSEVTIYRALRTK